jgi:hypothetical protein
MCRWHWLFWLTLWMCSAVWPRSSSASVACGLQTWRHACVRTCAWLANYREQRQSIQTAAATPLAGTETSQHRRACEHLTQVPVASLRGAAPISSSMLTLHTRTYTYTNMRGAARSLLTARAGNDQHRPSRPRSSRAA